MADHGSWARTFSIWRAENTPVRAWLIPFDSITDPVKIEDDLMQLFPREQWTMLSHLLIEHGRQICIARSPKCEACPLNDICPSSLV